MSVSPALAPRAHAASTHHALLWTGAALAAVPLLYAAFLSFAVLSSTIDDRVTASFVALWYAAWDLAVVGWAAAVVLLVALWKLRPGHGGAILGASLTLGGSLLGYVLAYVELLAGGADNPDRVWTSATAVAGEAFHALFMVGLVVLLVVGIRGLKRVYHRPPAMPTTF